MMDKSITSMTKTNSLILCCSYLQVDNGRRYGPVKKQFRFANLWSLQFKIHFVQQKSNAFKYFYDYRQTGFQDQSYILMLLRNHILWRNNKFKPTCEVVLAKNCLLHLIISYEAHVKSLNIFLFFLQALKLFKKFLSSLCPHSISSSNS